jgi:hypothetical protein
VYERRHAPVLPLRAFAGRLALHLGLVVALLCVSLAAGMVGFHVIDALSWLDAFFNASMLLGGMGPVFDHPLSDAGKLFAGVYALYCGLVVIAAMGIMLAPVVHRVMHRLHWEDSDGKAPVRNAGRKRR